VNLVSRNGKPAIANDAWCELERIVGLDRLGDRHVDVGLNGGRMYVGLDRAWRIIAPYGVSRSRVDELGNDHRCMPDAFACSAETRHNLSHTPAHAVICAHHERRAVHALHPMSLDLAHSGFKLSRSFSIDRHADDCTHVDRPDGDRITCSHKPHAVSIISLAHDYSLSMVVPFSSKSE
jgi:hypothetical protein